MNQLKIRRILALYDACILAMVDILMLVLYRSAETLTASEVLLHASISAVCIFLPGTWGAFTGRFGGMAVPSVIFACWWRIPWRSLSQLLLKSFFHC